MNIKLLSLIGVVLLAFVLRWLLPSDNGFTLYLRQRTTYIPLNLAAFWATLGIAYSRLLGVWICRLPTHPTISAVF